MTDPLSSSPHHLISRFEVRSLLPDKVTSATVQLSWSLPPAGSNSAAGLCGFLSLFSHVSPRRGGREQAVNALRNGMHLSMVGRQSVSIPGSDRVFYSRCGCFYRGYLFLVVEV
jgi:hypothetical protein